MALTGISILAIVIIIIGIIMLIIGIFLLETANSKGQPQKAYTWFLIIGGGIIALIGAIWLVFTLRPKQRVEVINAKAPLQVTNYPPPGYGTTDQTVVTAPSSIQY